MKGRPALFGFISILVGCAGVDSRPDILFVTLDTTRADALGVYGNHPSPSPAFDAIAKEGWLGEEALSVTPLTLPAHSSMFTGLYPDRHGVRDNGQLLADSHITLAERLSDAGYLTGAFVSSVVLDEAFGLKQGFEHYEDAFDLGASAHEKGRLLTWPAEIIRERGEAWMAAQSNTRPLFMWAHFYDAHHPLQPISPYAETFPQSAYLAEIYRVDVQWELLMKRIRETRDRPLLVVVVGDHGEGNGDHREDTHGQFVYRSTMQVPWAMAGPGIRPASREKNPVSLVDIAPTLLQLLRLSAAGDAFDGRDVLVEGNTNSSRFVYGETFHPRYHFGFSELRFLQNEHFRYIHAPDSELFQWATDPGEQVNLFPSLSVDEKEKWNQTLTDWKATRTMPTKSGGEVDAELKLALGQLGYLAGPVNGDVSETLLPDPKTAPQILARFDTAVALARSQPPEKGALVLEAFLAEFPDVFAARLLLTEALRLSGDLKGARKEIDLLMQRRPEDAQLLLRSGEIWFWMGALAEARKDLEEAQRLHPSHPTTLATLAEVHRREGNCEKAIQTSDLGLKYSSQDSRCLVVKAACFQEAGKWQETVPLLTTALAKDPRNADASYLLAMAQAKLGMIVEAEGNFRIQLNKTPGHALALAGLGLALYQQGQFASARDVLVQVVKDRSLGEEVVLAYADSLLRTDGDIEEVGKFLDEAQLRAPSDPRVHQIRSAMYMEKGEIERALEEMNLARGIGR